MTAVALAAPRLVGADLLKLRKRRSLAAVTGLLTVGAVVITYTVMELQHLASPATHGPAGGVVNVGHGTFLVAALGSVAAAIAGSTVGAGDMDAKVYRDLVVTGRSRRALFLSRVPAGFAYLLPFVAAADALASVVGVVFAGSNPSPGVGLLVEGAAWAMLTVAFYYLLAVGISCLVASRSYTIGILLGWQLALTPILAHISGIGIVRELVPGVALGTLGPAQFGNTITIGPHVGVSVGAVATVLLVWVAAALGLGGWRDSTRDA
jgi:hypothetical protein